MSRRQFSTYITLVVICILMSFAAGYLVRDRIFPEKTEFPILSQAHKILINNGIDPPPTDPSLEYGMIRGMVAAYGDPYTAFVEPVQHELDSNNLQGSFGGIGVQLVREDDGSLLLYPITGGPAETTGI